MNDDRSGHDHITIVVVEDHTLVREGTAELLERAPGLKVVGQAGVSGGSA